MQTWARSTEETTVARARVLLVGLDPDIVDYTKSPVPELTAAKVRAAVETDSANLETLGYTDMRGSCQRPRPRALENPGNRTDEAHFGDFNTADFAIDVGSSVGVTRLPQKLLSHKGEGGLYAAA
jgi:hypothetical protein